MPAPSRKGKSFALKSRLLIIFGVLVVALGVYGQPAQISGTVNLYSQVLDVDTCRNTLFINSSAGFSRGDRVLLIQMKGATIDTANSPFFGSLTSLGFAGHFEFATVDSVRPSRIRLRNRLVRPYDIGSTVQIVRIASYTTDIQVNGTVTGLKWNGITGGIIVIETPGNLSLGADIDASGIGFRGGDSSGNKAEPDVLSYKAPFNVKEGGWKGESIAQLIRDAETQRGPQYSGGGGGNSQNAGGGGGANGGRGGIGGDQTNFNSINRIPNGGFGGIPIDYALANGRIFLGSGGGGGHENDGQGTPGARGGGLVIIKAGSISSTGGSIKALGATADTAGVDGAGGGGAGGTVLLAVGTATNQVNIDVTGGNGGNNDAGGFTDPPACYAPGGGGGGGIAKIPAAIANVLVFKAAGKAGTVTLPGLPCFGNNYGSTDGDDGITNNDVNIFEGTVPFDEPLLDQHDITICEGDTARPRITGPAIIVNWSPATNISNPASLTPDLYPTSTSTYTVTMQDARGCFFSDSIRVTVKPRPKPVVDGPDTVCSQTLQTYYASNITPTSLKNWHVSGGVIVGDSTSDSVTISWFDITNGSVWFESAEDASGCSGIDSFSVLIFPTRKVTLSGVRDMCEGDSIEVTAESGYTRYLWSTGDTTDRITIGDSGTYHVQVFGGGPCITKFDTFHVSIRIPTKPQIAASRDTITSPCQMVQLDAGTGYLTYLWSTGDTTRTIATLDSGTFIVTVLDSIGCMARDTIEILRRDNGKARFTIKLDTLEGYPGDEIYYPVRVLSSENELLECSGNYRVAVHFNRSLLVPQQPYLWDRLEPRLRYVGFGAPFSGPDLNRGELMGIGFVATLGDTSETPIVIDSFLWDEKIVDYVSYDGLFRLLGICEEGDTRYVYTKGIQYITTPRPNPATDRLNFSYSTLETGYHEIILVDVMGRVVREILRASVEPSQHDVRLDVRGLATGQYFLIMRTPTEIFTRIVRIDR